MVPRPSRGALTRRRVLTRRDSNTRARSQGHTRSRSRSRSRTGPADRAGDAARSGDAGRTGRAGRALGAVRRSALRRAAHARGRAHRALSRALTRVADHLLDLLDPKRLLDLTLGSLLLALTAPLLTAVALALALSPRHPGRAFTREPRVGLNGRALRVRSLATRRHRLDLLSRLPHVVRGDLSLVGPAPLAPGDPGAAAPWRQSVRPGLTGLAQLRRHSPWPWDEPALLDQHYVEHHWIGLDLAILLRTPCATGAPHRTHAAAPRIPAQGHLSDTDHGPRGYSAAG
ncbi:sugar transferase [Streptomyces sp. NBC_01498]|uniref:sugar transferase n=1 Tax=Streptomyces sp. NBC_01498 TaxID=2975870 RepID=UPI002E7AF447|nr:sugar transferase [Streptomyces sp. NBC_01498]WTL25634.1 sugar transferase [Streptomyces sp. NBC_01498]